MQEEEEKDLDSSDENYELCLDFYDEDRRSRRKIRSVGMEEEEEGMEDDLVAKQMSSIEKKKI
jgi:hypothetical protein